MWEHCRNEPLVSLSVLFDGINGGAVTWWQLSERQQNFMRALVDFKEMCQSNQSNIWWHAFFTVHHAPIKVKNSFTVVCTINKET